MADTEMVDAKPGDTVELADKDTGFFDHQTEFKVVRDQKMKLGDTIGQQTNQALMSGRLLLVKPGRQLGAGKPADEESAESGGKKAANKEKK